MMKFMGAAAALCLTVAAGSLLQGNEANNAFADEPVAVMTVADGASVKLKDTAKDSGMRFNFVILSIVF